MKRFSLSAPFVILMALLVFGACKKKEDDTPTPDLVGTWKVNYVKSSNCDTIEDNTILDLTTSDCIEFFGFETCFDISYEFKADGAFNSSVITEINILGQVQTETETTTGTWSVEGNTLTICESNSSCVDAQYTLSGNNLTFMINDDPDDGCDRELRAIRQ